MIEAVHPPKFHPLPIDRIAPGTSARGMEWLGACLRKTIRVVSVIEESVPIRLLLA